MASGNKWEVADNGTPESETAVGPTGPSVSAQRRREQHLRHTFADNVAGALFTAQNFQISAASHPVKRLGGWLAFTLPSNQITKSRPCVEKQQRCRLCGTPCSGALTESVPSPWSAKDLVSSRSTRFVTPAMHAMRPRNLLTVFCSAGLLPPCQRLQQEEGHHKVPAQQGRRAQRG